MLLTNIDSLIWSIETENVYKDFHKDKDLFDFSNYKKTLKILQ